MPHTLIAAIFLTSMSISSHILFVTNVINPIPSRCSCLQERRLKMFASLGGSAKVVIMDDLVAGSDTAKGTSAVAMATSSGTPWN